MAIEYKVSERLTFTPELSQQVYDLLSFAARTANEKQTPPTYNPSALEELMDHYKPERINKWLHPDIASVLAYDGNTLVGTAFLSRRDNMGKPLESGTGHLTGFYANPNYSGRIGGHILRRIVATAKSKGISKIQSQSARWPDAVDYRRHGGRIVGEKPDEIKMPSGTLLFDRVEFNI